MSAGGPPGWRLNYPTVAAAISALAASADRASWSVTGTRYFACDTAAGSDSNAGYSDVSQAAAGLVAVKTLAKLLSIIPKFGCGRVARAAIKSGNYASDTTLDFSGFSGYQAIMFIGTDTVASAGAVAFAGDGNDTLCAGMTTATGMNAAGYNSTAYAVAGDGTVTMTVQLAGGGAPGFAAMPARPYGCRFRWDSATTTAALRNKASGIIFVAGGNTLTLSLPFGANPVASDVGYIEMPNVTGPTLTLITGSPILGPLSDGLALVGLSLGTLETRASGFRLSGCEAANFISQGYCDINVGETITTVPFVSPFSVQVGNGLRCTLVNAFGGNFFATGLETTSTTAPNILKGVTSLVWERSSSPTQWIVYGGSQGGGNNVVYTFGTNSSTAHGSTCQIWGTCAAPAGTARAGLVAAGPIYGGRVKFSNMGANPAVKVSGTNLPISIENFSGGAADGNTGVGVDLSPSGLSVNGQGAMGCTIALTAVPTVTGTAGDFKKSDGTIISWATAAAGVRDVNGNEVFAAGNAPP